MLQDVDSEMRTKASSMLLRRRLELQFYLFSCRTTPQTENCQRKNENFQYVRNYTTFFYSNKILQILSQQLCYHRSNCCSIFWHSILWCTRSRYCKSGKFSWFL